MNTAIKNFKCRICKTIGEYPIYTLFEMMYASREPFDYIHCSVCGCLQIYQIPSDLSRYYPSNYYSQLARTEPSYPSGIKGYLQQWYCRSAALTSDQVLGKLIRRFLPVPTDFAEFGHFLTDAKLASHTEKILDVGCGTSPHRLAAFHRCGFSEVEGIDPFISGDMKYYDIPIYRRTIDEMSGKYGLIMFHHSLEHVPDPVETLLTACALLRKGGTCLIRVPVMSTYFWRTFGVNWVELDAPRHLYIMEKRTIELLATNTGFRLRKTKFDSYGWEIDASIKYQETGLDVSNSILALNDKSDKQQKNHIERNLQDFENQAIELNQLGDGGRACFYLEKID